MVPHATTTATQTNLTTLFAVVLLMASCSPDSGSSSGPDIGPIETGGTTDVATGGATGSGGSADTGGVTSAGGYTSTGGASGVFGSGGSMGGADSGAAGSGGTSAGGAPTGTGGASILPTGTLFFDDFEDGDTKGWIADVDDGTNVGNWGVVTDGSTKVYEEQTEYSDPSFTVGGDVSWTDQALEAKVKFVSSSTSSPIAYLAIRLTTKKTYYFLEFHADTTNGSLKVRKRVDGSTTDLISSYKTGMPVVVGTWYTIGLSAIGSTISASFDGTSIGTATDSELTHGGIALGVVDAVAAFDDVKVTSH
jgi:hypothetical protein